MVYRHCPAILGMTSPSLQSPGQWGHVHDLPRFRFFCRKCISPGIFFFCVFPQTPSPPPPPPPPPPPIAVAPKAYRLFPLCAAREDISNSALLTDPLSCGVYSRSRSRSADPFPLSLVSISQRCEQTRVHSFGTRNTKLPAKARSCRYRQSRTRPLHRTS